MRFDAHVNIGGESDLPIPAEYAIAGACAALAISFIVLTLAWRTPRFNVDAAPRRSVVDRLGDVVDGPWFAPALRVLGFVFFLYVAAAAVFGPDSTINPLIGVFYVLLWIGIVPLSLLFGPFYKAISPVRTINGLLARVSGTDPEIGLRDYPSRWGYWPAALGLFAFVWMELVYPFSVELGSVRLWCATYIALMLVGGAVWGNKFYEHADPFEVYTTLVGHLSPWAREEGRLVLVNPVANLSRMEVRPGLVAVCAVLLGSTAFDSFKDSEFWLSEVQRTTLSMSTINLIGLVGMILIVGTLFTVAVMATGVHDGHSRLGLPNQFAHTLVPIVVGYVVAHYLRFLVQVGQQTLIDLSDPFGTGANYLGLSNRAVNDWLTYHPTFLAVTKVLGVVVGHVLAVIAAHDTAVRVLPRRHQLTGQLPLLMVMVVFTVGGLYLLFGG